jgi:pimeloyl-ACP methyl ester carboxylesterase
MHWAVHDPRVGAVVAIAPYGQPEQAFARMAQTGAAQIDSEVLHNEIRHAAAQLGIDWADWSGTAAIRQLKQPVFLVGGGKDTICTTNDLQVLKQNAPPNSKSLVVSEADHADLPYWFHELAEPVKAWFQAHLSTL